MSKFEIRRRNEGAQNISLKVDVVRPRGTPFVRSTSDATQGSPATDSVLGFLTRDVVVGGPSEIDRAQLYPGRLELPFAKGDECSLEVADAVECEGPDYISGTAGGYSDGIDANTALGTMLGFVDGRFRKAVSADKSLWRLGDKPTAEDAANPVRILAERVL